MPLHSRPAFAIVTALAVCVGAVRPAYAQSASDALVTPAAIAGDTDWVQPTAAKLRRSLASRGDGVWSVAAAADRFEEVASSPAPRVTETDIEEWVQRSRSAVRHLARGDYAEARKELLETQRLSEKAAEELNREASRARQVLDTCLYMVRALVETGRQAEARRRARDCRQLVPRVEPSPHRHTPEVQAVLDRVDREAARAKQGSLTVTSSPSGCGVRLNGVSFGRTPFALEDLTPGNYSVQVECDEPARGRVHRVAVKPGSNKISVDARFDQIIRTRPELALVYDDADARAAALDDAKQIAAALGVKRFFVLTVPSKGVLRIDELNDGVHKAAWVRTSRQGPSRAALDEGIAAIAGGRSVDFTGDAPVDRKPTEMKAIGRAKTEASGAAGDAPLKPPKRHRVAGFTLVGVGLASLTTGFALHAVRGDRGDTYKTVFNDTNALQDWLDLEWAVRGTAITGGAALTAAMPLVLPYRDKTPWWAWVTGAAGLGAAGFAIHQGIAAQDSPGGCQTAGSETRARDCVNNGQDVDRAILFASLAAPMITMPVVYLLRSTRAMPSVVAHRRGLLVSVQKRF